MICWIIPIIVGFLSFILGYLLGRLTRKPVKKEENVEWKSKYESANLSLNKCIREKNQLVKDLELCEKENKAAKDTFEPLKAAAIPQEKHVEPKLVFDGNLAKTIFKKKIIADDLTVVEGIGPKISELFKENGIKTWWKLANTSVERCQEVLDSGGERFKIHNPKTWPKQALLAYEGKWQKLFDWQEKLDGGV